MVLTGLYVNDLSMHDFSRDMVLAGQQQSAELKMALDQVCSSSSAYATKFPQWSSRVHCPMDVQTHPFSMASFSPSPGSRHNEKLTSVLLPC